MLAVIAAGGTGSRLEPLTTSVNKHLLPVHDKPMIFYALSTVMAAGAREVVIVTSPRHVEQFESLLGDGSGLGLSLNFAEQTKASGVGDVLLAAREVTPRKPFALILGDNFFYGPGLGRSLAEVRPSSGGHVFATRVRNPSDYGVVVLDAAGRPSDIQEKPPRPTTDLAIPGLYFYSEDVWDLLTDLQPSKRGELEISHLNKALLRDGRLTVDVLPRGTVWLDAGTVEALAEASEFVSVLQKRQGLLIGCPEEVALMNGWLSPEEVRTRGEMFRSSPYGEYLLRLAIGA